MRAISSESHETGYIRKSRRYTAIATLFVLGFLLLAILFALFLRFFVDDHLAFVLFSFMIMLFECVSAASILTCCYFAHVSPVPIPSRTLQAWMFIGIGLLLRGVKGVVYLAWQYIATPTHALIVTSSVSYLFYPLLIVGLFCMPGVKRLRISFFFELLIAIGGCAGIFWFLSSLSPEIPDKISASPSLLIDIIYISSDTFLLMILIAQFQKGMPTFLSRPFWLMGVSFVLFIATNLVHAGMVLASISDISEPWGFYPVLTFLSGSLLLALSILHQAHALYVDYSQQQSFNPWYDAMPDLPGCRLCPFMYIEYIYVPLAIFLYLLCFISIVVPLHYDQTDLSHFRIVVIVVSIGLTIRHFFATRENDQLLFERDKRYQESEQVRYLAAQLVDILEVEHLCQRIADTVVKKLGFSSVILLLIEERDMPLTSHSHFLVRTLSAWGGQAGRWRLNGGTLLYHIVSSGKLSKIQHYHVPDLPLELRLWCQKQRVESIDFYPLAFQGKILGCLGVSDHMLTSSKRTSSSTVRIYTEQIAAIIEYAYLYEEAREREMFARSMATISTRLNAVAMEPVEISQLICAEGVNALRADHVLFYQRMPKEDLLRPLSAYIDSLGRVTECDLRSWPLLRWSELAQDTIPTFQPFMLDLTQPGGTPEAESHPDLLMFTLAQNALVLFKEKLAAYTIETLIVAPMVIASELEGVFLFARSSSCPYHGFNLLDLPHVQDFVDQVSVAFTNAHLYQRLSNAHERLKELDQMKDQFIVTASHELRTPLTAVQGYIELIIQYDNILPPEQRQEFLGKAQLGCEELAVLLRNVMDASRIDADARIRPALLSSVSVKEMLEKVLLMIGPQSTHERRKVTIDLPDDLFVRADPVRLHQVLLNVSSNALKYSPPGTPLCFSARPVEGNVRAVVISIRDYGNGVVPHDHERLFQRFYRLERDVNSPVRGSGLGLYISQRLVQAMGGKIWIESAGIPGEGSTFSIRLPMP